MTDQELNLLEHREIELWDQYEGICRKRDAIEKQWFAVRDLIALEKRQRLMEKEFTQPTPPTAKLDTSSASVV